MLSVAAARPPHVRFEMRPVEDREQTIALGRRVYKDVAFALVTPAGSRDTMDRVAEDWIRQLRDASLRNAVDPELDVYNRRLLEAVDKAFQEWKAGNTMPVDGTSIKHSQIFTPAELENCTNLHIYTLEALAELSEEGLGRLGMGGRQMKERAKNALAQAAGNDLALKIEAKDAKIGQLEEKIEKLETIIAEMAQNQRPRKAA